MRLRELAISQSIVFFAPPEVHQSILNFGGKAPDDFVDSRDVVAWLLEQTCCSIEQLQPLYISQGFEYCRRRVAAQRNPDATSRQDQRKAYLKVLEQPEQYSLENLYAPDQRIKSRPVDAKGFPEIIGYLEKLDEMKKGLRNTGDTVQALTHQGVYICGSICLAHSFVLPKAVGDARYHCILFCPFYSRVHFFVAVLISFLHVYMQSRAIHDIYIKMNVGLVSPTVFDPFFEPV